MSYHWHDDEVGWCSCDEVTDETTVEIGGQVMTQDQFDAARYPLTSVTPPEIEEK